MDEIRAAYDNDVFISYSTRQAREAYLVRDVLTANGLSCWMAPESIPAGSDYTAEIPRALAGCKAVVLILSAEAQHSDYVRSEVRRAIRNGKTIIPFAIRNCKIEEAFDFLISRYQRINAYKGLSDALEELVTTVYTVAEKSAPQMDDSYLKCRLRRFRKRRAIMIIAAVTAAAVLFSVLTPVFVNLISARRERDASAHGVIGDCAWAYDSESATLTISGDGATDEKSGSYVEYAPWQEYMDSIGTLIVEDGVTSLCAGALSNARRLETVTLPATLTVIGSTAFSNCVSLKTIDLPEGLKKLGRAAFYNCTSLKELHIPASTEEIGGVAFIGSGLCTITVDEKNAAYCSADGCLYNKKQTELICYPTGLTGTAFTVPDTVENIADSAFNSCWNLRSVTLPDSVKKIGVSAFAGCKNLREIRLPENLVSIGEEAFYVCSSLTEIKMSDSVMTAGERCFANCTALKSVTLSSKISGIPKGMFQYCTELSELRIPEGVVYIRNNAFLSCTGLERIDIPDTVTQIDEGAFSGCSKLTIVGTASGYAASYAADNGITFEAE